jgi:hypothetical protein
MSPIKRMSSNNSHKSNKHVKKFIFFGEIVSFISTILPEPFRLCLRVWRGGEGMVLKKRKKQVEGIEKFGREGVWRVIFSS